MHHVSNLVVKNFRSCCDVNIILSHFTPIVGYNNGGKSNILSALQWLLVPTKLSERDFWDSAQPVEVEATITGIDDSVLDALASVHRKKVEPCLVDGEVSIRRLANSPGVSPSKTVEEVLVEGEWKPNPGGIWAAIKKMCPEPIRVGAMEDSAEDAAKFKTTTTLGRLIAEVSGPIVEQCAAEFDTAIESITAQLDADGERRPTVLNDFDRDATAAASEFFPGVSVRLHVPPPELSDVLKTGTLRVYENEDQREFDSLGHGGQRSIQMALIKMLAERKSEAASSGSTRLLLIDEPELYLHPQSIEQIRDALRTLTESGYQVVFSTHSPIMISSEDVSSAALIVKKPGLGTEVRPTLKVAVEKTLEDNESQTQLLFSLGNASEILFSESVLLAEGVTERRLLPLLYRHINGHALRAAKIALVSLGGVGSLHKSFDVLHALKLPTRAIVDLDYAFQGGRRAGIVDASDADVAACISILTSLKSDHDFSVDAEGLPCKGGSLKPAEAYEILAGEPTALPHIQSLHEKLLAKDIWMWTKGAAEAHLGLTGKGESVWSQYAVRLERESLNDVVVDLDGVTRLIEWITSD